MEALHLPSHLLLLGSQFTLQLSVRVVSAEPSVLQSASRPRFAQSLHHYTLHFFFLTLEPFWRYKNEYNQFEKLKMLVFRSRVNVERDFQWLNGSQVTEASFVLINMFTNDWKKI